MKTILIFGTSIVNLALISYSIGIITEQRKHKISPRVLRFLSLGLFFDITATILMIIGSENPAFTIHGFVGYSSLTGMLIDAILIWRLRLKKGADCEVPKGLHIYTRLAYIWWILAYITGALIVMLK
ncbi:hypothetical protein ACFLTU_08415 [Bacteroidota bacterium]